MHSTARTVLKVLLSLTLGLFSLPLLVFGGYLFVCWFRIHTSDVYYVEYGYATSALVWIGLGILSLWATLRAVWRRSFYGSLFAAPILLGLAAMVYIPELLPRASSTTADSNYLFAVDAFFRVWYENNNRFPSNESEFSDALSKGPAAWEHKVGTAPESRYSQRGKPLPYEIVVVNNANGPQVADVSQRPGVIYYCVSRDLQEFWVTVTGLQSDVASSAQIGRIAGLPNEEIRMVHAAGRDYPVKKP